MKKLQIAGYVSPMALLSASSLSGANDKVLLWGDTHLHTADSPDAFFFDNEAATSDVAYRYAKGFPW